MKNVKIYALMDLMDEIKKIDAIILLHKNTADNNFFMTSQYEAKKVKLVAQLIDALAAPAVQSEKSFSLIQKIISRFYPANKSEKSDFKDEDWEELIATI